MSLIRAAEEECQCDFPMCGSQFDHAPGARCAIRGSANAVKAFCADHSHILAKEGVMLRSLDEIHAEIREERERPIREMAERERLAIEHAFIADLLKRQK